MIALSKEAGLRARKGRHLRFGLIGAGHIGRVHAAALARGVSRGAVLAAVADRSEAAARRLAAAFPCDAVEVDRLVDQSALDAVIIATPPDSHEALAVPLLARGVAVLCEKPMAATIGQARRLAARAEQAGALLAISAKFLFCPSVRAAAEHLRGGSLGPTQSLRLRFALRKDFSDTWYVDPVRSGGGVLIDRGPQALDLVRALVGEPVAVAGVAEAGTGCPVEDAVDLTIETASGAQAACRLSWRETDRSDTYARLDCDDGCIELGWTAARLSRSNQGWTALGPGYDQRRVFSAQLDAFARRVRDDAAAFDPSVDQSLRNAEIIEALYRSGLEGRRIAVPLQPARMSSSVPQTRSIIGSVRSTPEGR